MFTPKSNVILPFSMSKLIGNKDFKRIKYPKYIIITALSIFYLVKSSFRNIAVIVKVVNNIKVSYAIIIESFHHQFKVWYKTK